MIEIILDDERYIFYATDILKVNAYYHIVGSYIINLDLKEELEISLDFGEDYKLYNDTYEKILNKMKEADNHD